MYVEYIKFMNKTFQLTRVSDTHIKPATGVLNCIFIITSIWFHQISHTAQAKRQ